jgi:hypothetical protein
MPHDDVPSPGWFDTLLDHLEEDPDLLMTFGRLEPVDLDGRSPAAEARWIVAPPHPAPRSEWNVHDAVGVLRWTAGIAFRGVFRRHPVVANGHYLPSIRGDVDADATWVFGMALLGPLRYVPEVACRKRYHDASAHAQWVWSSAQRLSAALVRAKYALRYPETARAKTEALVGVARYQTPVVFAPIKRRLRRAIAGTRATNWLLRRPT